MEELRWKKNKYLRLLVLFFVLMIAFTLVSRAADSITVAKVVCVSPTQGSLTHQVSGNGVLEAADRCYVEGTEGFRVEKIHVDEGEHVEEGALLFTLDGESIKEQLAQVGDEIAALDLRLEKLTADEASGELQSAVDDGEIALQRALDDEAINTELNGGKQLLADKRKIEDAQKGLADARRRLTEQREQSRIERKTIELERSARVREERRLSSLAEKGGRILAETSGTVSQINIQQGGKTTGETICLLIPDDSEFLLRMELSSEDGNHIEAGDPLKVTLPGKSQTLSGVTVKSIQHEEHGVKMTAVLPAEIIKAEGMGSLSDGMTVTVSHKKETERFLQVIPLSAVRGSEGNWFVLVTMTSNTILGEETKARSVQVELMDQDGNRAAVKGEIDGKVITESSKPIAEGDRVREQRKQ